MTLTVDGATRLHVIIGDPIAQVKSPGGMSAAFAAAGRNALMLPVHVAAADLAAFVHGFGLAQNADGLIATVPHKFACYALCKATTERAKILGAVNVMRRMPGGGWFGDMFDGAGFVGGVRSQGGEPSGKRALLIGAGGAGSAIALELLLSGVSALAIHDADVARRDGLIGRLNALGKAPVTAGSSDPAGFGLVAHATPAGMQAADPMPIDVSALSPDTFVGCVITAPAASPLIVAARARGCPASTGGDMYRAQQDLIVRFLMSSGTAPGS
jgi:shikimate dehydrogenase